MLLQDQLDFLNANITDSVYDVARPLLEASAVNVGS